MRKLSLPDRDKSKPVLSEEDYIMVRELGIREIKKQAREIVEQKLRKQPENDGHQTPKAGNPVYKAMHACNCHSRRSLSRTFRIPAGRTLTDTQIDSVVNLLTRWIAREYNFYKEENKQKQGRLKDFLKNQQL